MWIPSFTNIPSFCIALFEDKNLDNSLLFQAKYWSALVSLKYFPKVS